MTKTAIVTGASRGLGLELARALAARNWALAIDARHAGPLEAARVELASLTSVVALDGDVRDSAHLTRLVDEAARLGPLSAVINNASLLGPSPQPPLATYPLSVLREVYEANVFAPLRLMQLVLPRLEQGARIINVTSDAGVESYEGWGGYGSSKAALEQLTGIFAAEHPELRVYWVDPGDMRTQMQQEAFPGEDISDRPLPSDSAPAFLTLLEGDLPSGRYRASELRAAQGVRG
ncbi:MAG: SDR family oxidoreductase [Actinomycetota bacterium]|nr:SDR family oxidoreductase [Actinomycetota bacterium]